MYEVVELERGTTWSDGSPVIIRREKCESVREAAVLCVARNIEHVMTEYDGSYFELWEDGSPSDDECEPQDDEVYDLLSVMGYQDKDILQAMGESTDEETEAE